MIFLAGARLVTLSDEVTQQMRRFTEPPEADLEAGGILLGSYRGPHVEVLQCTTPNPSLTDAHSMQSHRSN
jgi:hypothetical protein